MKEFLKKYWMEILLGILCILVIILGVSMKKMQDESQRWKDNYYVAIDSVKVVELKNGELAYERDLYKLNYDELNEEYKKKVKDLEKDLNTQIKIISDLKTNIRIDTLICRDSIYIKDDVTHIDFKYNDEWLTLNGTTILDDTTTSINSIFIDVPLTLGIGDNYDNLFITSPNPYVTISKIDGYHLNHTPKSFDHWDLRAGVNMRVQKNILSNSLDIIPAVNVDLRYLFKNNVYINAFTGIEFITSMQRNDIGCYIGIGGGYSFRF
jgi:hypothetical protein